MTAAPSYTALDYRTAFQATMPRGAAWPREPDAVQTAVITGLSQSMARLDGDANQLLVDLFPATAQALLPEWEASLGLPDLVVGQAPSHDKRRRAVVARLAGAQGFSRPALKLFANALGYDLTVTAVAPFRASQSAAGQPLADLRWANTVILKVAPSAAPPFTDALTAWDLAFCLAGLKRMAPAHLTVITQS